MRVGALASPAGNEEQGRQTSARETCAPQSVGAPRSSEGPVQRVRQGARGLIPSLPPAATALTVSGGLCIPSKTHQAPRLVQARAGLARSDVQLRERRPFLGRTALAPPGDLARPSLLSFGGGLTQDRRPDDRARSTRIGATNVPLAVSAGP